MVTRKGYRARYREYIEHYRQHYQSHYRALQSALQSITESTQRVHRVSTQRANRVLLGSYIERLQRDYRARYREYIESTQRAYLVAQCYWLGSEATASQLQWTVVYSGKPKGWPITTKRTHQQAISAQQSVIQTSIICYCDQHNTIQHYSIFLLASTCFLLDPLSQCKYTKALPRKRR